QFAPPALTPPLAPGAPPPGPITLTPPAPPAGQPSLVRPVLPDNKNASVVPRAGQPGDTFFFDARGFTPGENVAVWVNAPDGSVLGADFQATANKQGTISDAQVVFQ